MDRLSSLKAALGLLALGLGGCGEPSATVVPEGTREAPPSRVEAVGARQEDPAVRFCDVSAPLGEGRPLVLPLLEGAPAPTTGWRWINVWATWCAPCVEEMPRLVEWGSRLRREGAPVSTFFVSVDATGGEVEAFRQAHPDAPPTARLLGDGALPAMLSALGLDTGATIPIHALVDPEGRLRCVRTGAVTERDYPTVRAILRGR